MAGKEDWRYDNGYLLAGRTFVWKKYRAPRPEWNHDHCSFCFAEFAEFDSEKEEILHEGYATPDEYYWICPTCFADFRESLQLKGGSPAEAAPVST